MQYYHCLICNQFKTKFIQKYQGYNYTIGILRPCCSECEPALLAMSREQAGSLMHRALHRYYQPGQVIYTLHESDTSLVRYIGRTLDPKKRLQQHLYHQKTWPISYQEDLLKRPDDTVYYTTGYWLYDLKQRGVKPVMDIVEQVNDGPMVVPLYPTRRSTGEHLQLSHRVHEGHSARY